MENFLRGKIKGAGTAAAPSSNKADVKPSTSSTKSSNAPWIEKYRPRTVDDVVQQDEVVAVLKKVLQGADLPNLLFYGPPGTGKTSTILAMARELFGIVLGLHGYTFCDTSLEESVLSDVFRGRILELNASDERGIQVVREKIKNFAQLTASGVRPDGRPCPPLKIIILDEADSMTSAAQLSHDVLHKRLAEICDLENVQCDPKALEALISTSDGDLRKAITSLQSAHRLKGKNRILANDVYEIAGVIPDTWLNELLDKCTSSYEKLEEYVQEIMAEGFAVIQIFYDLHDKILNSVKLSNAQKSAVLQAIAVAEHQLIEGANEYLQLMVVCTTISQQLQNN